MRILFLPVYDPSHHAVSVANKHGLRDALIAAGHEVKEVDYCAMSESKFRYNITDVIREIKPDLLLSQFQGINYMDSELAIDIITQGVEFIWANFNQDYWPEHHTSPDMLALLRHVDLQLVSNGSVLPDYAANGVNAAYWPFGYETPNRPLPEAPHHDVVFLGNAYSEHRRKLGKLLKSLPYNVGLYGTGWENADGDCNYDFTYGEALYKNAKIAISDNEFTDAVGYLSNRPFQILAAGGALLLQQNVVDLCEMTGLNRGIHYSSFADFEDLVGKINYWMMPSDWLIRDRQSVVDAGYEFVRENHSYDVRVRELMAMVEGIKA